MKKAIQITGAGARDYRFPLRLPRTIHQQIENLANRSGKVSQNSIILTALEHYFTPSHEINKTDFELLMKRIDSIERKLTILNFDALEAVTAAHEKLNEISDKITLLPAPDRDGFAQGEPSPKVMTGAEIKGLADDMTDRLRDNEKELFKELDAEWSPKKFYAAESWTPPPITHKITMFGGYTIWIVFAVVATTIVTLGAAYTPPPPYNFLAVFGVLVFCLGWFKVLLWMDQFERYWGTQGYNAWEVKHPRP